MEVEFTSELDVRLVGCAATDDDVVQAMLVSTQGADSLDTTATLGRINFLMKNRHGTPFEHNHFKFYIAAPIFVFREFHRHRIGWSYNEESGRYKKLDPKFYIPKLERPMVQVGKPGAYEYVVGEKAQQTDVFIHLRDSYYQAYLNYDELLGRGIAKEVARMCLPVGIYSSMYATCNARSLMAFLSLRRNVPEATFPSTPMWEIEQIARQMEEFFKWAMPLTHNAFVENGYVAP